MIRAYIQVNAHWPFCPSQFTGQFFDTMLGYAVALLAISTSAAAQGVSVDLPGGNTITRGANFTVEITQPVSTDSVLLPSSCSQKCVPQRFIGGLVSTQTLVIGLQPVGSTGLVLFDGVVGSSLVCVRCEADSGDLRIVWWVGTALVS